MINLDNRSSSSSPNATLRGNLSFLCIVKNHKKIHSQLLKSILVDSTAIVVPNRVKSTTRVTGLSEHLLSVGCKIEVGELAEKALDLQGAGFQQVVNEVVYESNISNQPIDHHHIQEALKKYSGKKQGLADVSFNRNRNRNRNRNHKQKAIFENIGGNEAAKTALHDALNLDRGMAEKLREHFSILPVCGVLLYGPPGTGKTLLARGAAAALKREGGGNGGGGVAMLRASEVVQGEIGVSEKLVRDCFETMRREGGGVVFVDEFEALFRKRGEGEGGSRLASVLLECMNDFRGGGEERVVVLAATNLPWEIERAFLRPGRFDRVVYVGIPNEKERGSILVTIMSGMRVEEGSVDVERIAGRTEGFSGADLSVLMRTAGLNAVMRGGGSVGGGDVEEALGTVKRSLTDAMVSVVRDWKVNNLS
ncbi:hypothetical protein ScalyP_jg9308 [Parmales sp. scaly parma]|nr:hypothetical protein ScalyP_jg9308 [Parmales sp. scaly parma]